MDWKRPRIVIDFLKDIFNHHRKVTAFQKTVGLSCFLGLLIVVFRSWWMLGLTLSYCLCLYLSVKACQLIVEYHSHFPTEFIPVFLENVDKLFENCRSISQQTDETGQTHKIIDQKNPEEGSTDDEFYDAHDDNQSESQSTFYVDLDREMPSLGGAMKFKTSEANRQRYIHSDIISKYCPQVIQIEISRMISLIERDFIMSWYNLFSKHLESLDDANEILQEITVGILQRLPKVDIKTVAKTLMCMFSNHVKKCKEARMIYKVQTYSKRRRKSSAKSEGVNLSPALSPVILKSVEECFASKVDFHTALKSSEIEYLYLKSLTELLIIKLMPDHLNDSKALVCAVREIVTCNVLISVMNLICDPTFLHERIIKITSEEEPGRDLDDSQVFLDACPSEEESLKSHPETFTIGTTVQNDIIDSSSEQKRLQSEPQNAGRRRSSFLDDTKLYFVPRGMCNECNRLCSKDRDKIEPHPHTCSLGQEPDLLKVKDHDKDRLSTSSHEGSPVFKFCIADVNNVDEDSSCNTQHSNAHDIPNDLNNIPNLVTDKIFLQKVPVEPVNNDAHQTVLSRPSDSLLQESDKTLSAESLKEKELLNETVQHNSLTHDIDKSQGKTPGHSATEQASNISTDVQESNFLPNFGGSLFNFKFPQFGSRPLKDKNRSSSNLEQLSDTEAEDFSNLRRSKSSADFSVDEVVSGHEPLLYSTEAPLPFQDIHIEKTETAKEAGSLNPYTLYLIEYEAIHPTEEGIFVHKSGKVKRRFREFVNLQLRLEDNPLYKRSLKDIKGPKKWLTLPFGNMDTGSIESRRKILTTFLSSLIKKEDICKGPELKEFLGYSGDGHIAFVRKVPENTGPRIDQRLVKTMSGVFDKIVEVLPSLPNELPRIIKTEKSRDDSETDKLVDDCDQFDLETKFDEDLRRIQRLHKALEDFVEFESVTLQHSDHEGDSNTTLGTSVLEWQEACSRSGSPAKTQHCDLPLTKPQTDSTTSGQDPVPLCNALLDILSELLSGHDSWMCRESVMKSIKTVVGRALERYLSSKIDYLVSAEMNTFYLRTLRETVWPADQLLSESRPNYTDRQKEGIKKQAARCLGNFLPGVLHRLLGDEDFDFTIEEIMESIKCEKLNRHFWYTFLDVVVEHIFPEIKTEEIHRKLSRS